MLYKARTSMLQLQGLKKTLNNVQIGAIMDASPVDLVEFPPIIVKLRTNGVVIALDAVPFQKKP